MNTKKTTSASEEEQNKKSTIHFRKDDLPKLKTFMETAIQVYKTEKECYQVFGKKYGYSETQVKRNYTEKIRPLLNLVSDQDDLKENFTNDYNVEMERVQEEKEKKKKPKIEKESTEEIDQSDDSYITKTLKYESDVFAFHHFESRTHHVFAVRYPNHFVFEFKGVSRKEKELLIDVSICTSLKATDIQSIFDSNNVEIEKLEEKTDKSTSVYTLKQVLPKNADVHLIKQGIGFLPDSEDRVFLLYCEKKVDILKPSSANSFAFSVSAKPKKPQLESTQRPIGQTQGASSDNQQSM